MQDSSKHKELGDFLRTRRMRISPEEAGLKNDSMRRRTPGLRREEVAALSGISLAWYTNLEQGRPIRVSEQVLESLSRTLKLDKDEKSICFYWPTNGCLLIRSQKPIVPFPPCSSLFLMNCTLVRHIF